jgi:hypothetical protein
MKVSAHPLMVAVALGLLGPNALSADSSEDEAQVRPASPPGDDETSSELSHIAVVLDDETGPAWSHLVLEPLDRA